MSLPPKHTEVLVVGGGPAGSYSASALAREGVPVALFEAARFPRTKIGESLIPSCRHFLRFIGAEDVVAQAGFQHKPGAAIKFTQFKQEGYTDFVALGKENASWNVVRAEFDQILLNHARASGASIFENTRVTSVTFSPTDPSKPVAAVWEHTSDDGTKVTGSTSFDYLVDASGRAGILSTQYLKNRHFNTSLKNIANWGYWASTGIYGSGTSREGAPFFEALTDQSGWAWFIPLSNGTTSVGVVMNQQMYNDRPTSLRSPFADQVTPNPTNSTLVTRYLRNLSLAPDVVKLISPKGKMLEGQCKSASDFSYSASVYAGTGYRIIGDAGGFIDPFFSSGIHLAMTSALSAVSTICAARRGDCSEQEAGDWHTQRVSTSYTRFQLVVLSAYKQMHAQAVDVLSDVGEASFDRAFAALRPIIHGAGDMGARLSELELQKSLDFCVKMFDPVTLDPQQAIAVEDLLDLHTPLVHPDNFRSRKDEAGIPETRMLLDKVNARRLVQAEYAINNFQQEPLLGYVVRLEEGRLGLSKA